MYVCPIKPSGDSSSKNRCRRSAVRKTVMSSEMLEAIKGSRLCRSFFGRENIFTFGFWTKCCWLFTIELVNIRGTLSCNQGHTLTKTRGTVFKEFLKDKFKGHCQVSILGYLSVKEQTNNQSPHTRHCRRLLSPNLWRFCWGPQPKCTSFFNLAAVLGLTWIYMKQGCFQNFCWLNTSAGPISMWGLEFGWCRMTYINPIDGFRQCLECKKLDFHFTLRWFWETIYTQTKKCWDTMAASPGAMNSALSLVESSSWVETGFPRPVSTGSNNNKNKFSKFIFSFKNPPNSTRNTTNRGKADPQQIKIWIPANVSNVGVKSWSFL